MTGTHPLALSKTKHGMCGTLTSTFPESGNRPSSTSS